MLSGQILAAASDGEGGWYICGRFTHVGGVARTNLARIRVDNTVDPIWNPDLNVSAGYYASGAAPEALLLHRGRVYVAGRFVTPQGVPAHVALDAAGDEPLFYQWRHDGINLPGATNAVLVLQNAQVADSGTYTVIVSNRLGQATSDEASVVVLSQPLIIQQPQARTVAPGGAATLSAVAAGYPTPTYQWRLNGANIPGQTQPTLAFTNAQPSDSGTYSMVAVNLGGAATSDLANLIVTSPSLPLADNLRDRAVTNSLTGVGSGSNTNATRESGEPFHAGKPGGKSVWLGWHAPTNGVARFSTRGSGFDTLLAVYTNAVPGAPLNVTNLGSVVSDDDRGGFLTSEAVFNAVQGTEYLIAVDGFGGASGNIVLSWTLDPNLIEAPRIFQQPASQVVSLGQEAVFTVAAFSRVPLYYQWFFNCDQIPGATNAQWVVTNVQPASIGRYAVRVGTSPDELTERDLGQCRACLGSLPAYLEVGLEKGVPAQDKLADLLAEERGQTRPARGTAALRGAPRPLQFPSVAAGFLGTRSFSNFGATTELNEPNHAGVMGGASMWFELKASSNGTMVIDTLGSDFDTILAVYTGTSYLDLKLVAADQRSAPDGIRSLVRFGAVTGTAYLIAVDGVNGDHGTVNLNWRLGTAPVMTQTVTNRIVRAGETVRLEVVASGTPPPSYQWLLNGTNLIGATNAALTLTGFQPAQAGSYSVVASNFVASVTNVVAVLALEGGVPLILQTGGLTTNGALRVRVRGAGSGPSVIQATTNFINWLPLTTNFSTDGTFEFLDPEAAKLPWRFYRGLK